MARYPLSVRLDDAFDPTDADRAMTVAARSLALLRVCQRVLFAETCGMRVGRDDALRLAVSMRDVAVAIRLLQKDATGAQTDAFHSALAVEAGLPPTAPDVTA